ncbi:MAG: heavy metal translocating P-type ATPase [Trueperaceae bacterium]
MRGGAAGEQDGPPVGSNDPATFAEDSVETLQMKVGGMSCSFCVASINQAFGRMEGVEEANVSLAHEEALVRYRPGLVTPERLKETLLDLGYVVRDPGKVRTFEEEEAELAHERNNLLYAAAMTLLALLGAMSGWFGMAMGFVPAWLPLWLMPTLALAIVFGPGWRILTMAWASLRRGILNQHVLLEFGAFAGLTGGFLAFVVPAFPLADFFAVAVFITTYHLLSGFVSLRVRTRSSQAVRKLLELVPATARVVRDGREQEVPLEQVAPGELVRVRPGESVPVDGEVVEGASGVDQSLVTGESIPEEKGPGDQVIGGSLNQTGSLLVRVTTVGSESFLQQVARQVEEARALKPGIMQLVDVVLRYYVPGVLAFAGLGIAIWTLGAWLVTGEMELVRAIFAALAVLVMGYPCALGMATPLALIRGGGIAAQKGILMRSGEAFEVLKDVRKVVLDKTGTITRGRPAVTEVVAMAGFDVSEALRLARAVESSSEHPLARAVVAAAEERGPAGAAATEFESTPGKGVTALVEGKRVSVGSPRFIEAEVSSAQREGADGSGLAVDETGDPGGAGWPADLQERLEELQSAGNTVAALAVDGRLAALIAIADELKPDAAESVALMREVGLEPVMLTGDNPRTARAVAESVDITEYRAEVLPQDKAEAVRELQRQGFRVVMVGDGINDAPALMQADVGMAIGAGTDIAIESADVVLMGERLGAVVDAYRIGKSSYRKTVQNLSLAFAFNGIGVPLATTGLVHPAWAMAAMVASVTAVLVNSFAGRLLPDSRRGQRREARFEVANMHCQNCLRTIRSAVGKLPGILEVRGDPDKRIVIVAYDDDRITRGGIREAIVEGGFRATVSAPVRSARRG